MVSARLGYFAIRLSSSFCTTQATSHYHYQPHHTMKIQSMLLLLLLLNNVIGENSIHHTQCSRNNTFPLPSSSWRSSTHQRFHSFWHIHRILFHFRPQQLHIPTHFVHTATINYPISAASSPSIKHGLYIIISKNLEMWGIRKHEVEAGIGSDTVGFEDEQRHPQIIS